MAGPKLSKKEQPRTPKSLTDVARLQQELSFLLRNIEETEHHFREAHEKLTKEEHEAIVPLKERAVTIARCIYRFAAKHKDTLTGGGKKFTVTVPNGGSFRWYKSPPGLIIHNPDELLDKLKALGLKRFIRVKEEINRQSLIGEPELAKTINGVEILRQQKFAVQPPHARMRLECSETRPKWTIVAPKK